MSELRRVSNFSNFEERLEALVHESVRADQIEAVRHQVFIFTRLFMSLIVLAALPVYIVVNGALSPLEIGIFALATCPLAASLVVSRSGNLFAGHLVCICAIFALSCLLIIATGANSGIGIMWLALAPVEAFLTGSFLAIIAASGGALLIAGLALLASMFGHSFAAATIAEFQQTIMVAVAIIYTSSIGIGGIYVSELRRRQTNSKHVGFRSLSEAIGDLVLQLDRSGAVGYVSSNCDTLFNLPSAELIGRGLFNRVHVADRPAYLKAVSDASSGTSVVAVTLRLRAPPTSGDQAGVLFRWIELRVNKLENDIADRAYKAKIAGAVDHAVIAVVRDVTNIKMHQEQLEAAKSEADRASLWKDRFLANVSHELRTPLNAIIGFSEILATEKIAPKDPEKSREYAQIIRESGEHLLSVVNSILDISKIEAGSFDIVPESFEVAPLVDNCIDMLRLRADSGGVELRKELHPAIDELVADKRAVKQVLINLLSNAVKFTPEDGCVTVGLRPEGNSALLWVRDNGIGISETELSRIGEPFFQAASSFDRPYEGTGLGLSVVRGLVGLHGGSITIESGPGAGTCVAIKLPLDCRLPSAGEGLSANIQTIPLPAAKAGPADFSLHDGAKKVA